MKKKPAQTPPDALREGDSGRLFWFFYGFFYSLAKYLIIFASFFENEKHFIKLLLT